MRKSLDVSRTNRTPMWNVPSVDDMFERMLRNPFALLDEIRPSLIAEGQWFRPNFDVEESDQAYLLTVDLPGVKKEDIKIDLSENVLTISGERKQEYEGKEKGMRHYERSYGQFSRSFTLPQTVDVNKIEANLEDGVLTIALPKSEQVKPRSIEVQSGKSGFLSRLLGAGKKQEKDAGKTQAGH